MVQVSVAIADVHGRLEALNVLMEYIDKNFAGVPEDVRHRIVHANVAELYGMELPSKGIA